MAKVKPIPDEYPQVTPYLCIDGANAAIEFYRKVFGATERMRLPAPGGKIGHAELQIGNSATSRTFHPTRWRSAQLKAAIEGPRAIAPVPRAGARSSGNCVR